MTFKPLLLKQYDIILCRHILWSIYNIAVAMSLAKLRKLEEAILY
jgi:hypothetical protein